MLLWREPWQWRRGGSIVVWSGTKQLCWLWLLALVHMSLNLIIGWVLCSLANISSAMERLQLPNKRMGGREPRTWTLHLQHRMANGLSFPPIATMLLFVLSVQGQNVRSRPLDWIHVASVSSEEENICRGKLVCRTRNVHRHILFGGRG